MSALRVLHVVPYFEHAWAYGGIPRVATDARARAGRAGTPRDGLHDRCLRPAGAHAGAPDARTRGREPSTSGSCATSRTISPITGSSSPPTASAARCGPSSARIDVAHLHACRNLPVAAAARILAKARVPYVVSPHGTAPLIERRFLAKQIFDATAGRGYLEGAARVLAVSEAERAQLQALGVADDRIAVLPNPIDLREFDPAPDGCALSSAARPRRCAARPAPRQAHAAQGRRRGAARIRRSFAARRAAGHRRERHGIRAADRRLEAARACCTSACSKVATASTRSRPRTSSSIRRSTKSSGSSRSRRSSAVRPSSSATTAALVRSSARSAADTSSRLMTLTRSRRAIESMLASTAVGADRARMAGREVRQLFDADIVCERLEALYRDVIDCSVAEDRRSA